MDRNSESNAKKLNIARVLLLMSCILHMSDVTKSLYLVKFQEKIIVVKPECFDASKIMAFERFHCLFNCIDIKLLNILCLARIIYVCEDKFDFKIKDTIPHI